MKNFAAFIVVLIVVLVAAIWWWVGPIAQDTNDHLFADAVSKWGINNFWNVVSNVPFLGVGLMGLWSLYRRKLRVAADYRVFTGCFSPGY